MKKVIAFDFDGTLIDSMDTLADIAADLINEYYGLAREMARELFLRTSGRPFAEQMERIFPGQSRNKELVTEFERRKNDSILEEPLYPEVKQVLGDLKKLGYITIISSSNLPEVIERYVKHHNLEIEMILGFKAPDFFKGTPHFKFVKEHYRISDEELLFVGDSPEDYEHSAKNRIDFIGRTGTFNRERLTNAGAGCVVDSLAEILKILGH